MKFNNKDAARFDKGKVKCYKCSELGHFARECTGKQVDSKARYSSFKLQELNKGEETKALLSVDSMVNWSDHEGEDVEIGAAQVYGMIAGAEEDATGNAADDVSNDAAEFALMGALIPASVPTGSRNRQTSVPTGSRNRRTSVPASRPFSVDGEKMLLLSPQQVVLGEYKGQICNGDPRPMVLSKEFQLPEDSQVVLRIPRRNNLYCFNLSDIQPESDVTCLLAKASLAESTKWHRRMAHVNFKNMNKLAKHGLVNGLPSKLFTNEHNCVACNKGKQHKASYKAITAVSTISAPLQLLHMDLFGPTSIRSIDHKYYSLVVTDDFSRFTWVFFLGTKDETYGDYSNARTPQQNGVAERKNRTLIEAARTMLADSMLPTMFWTEAVSTACYVLNRVLVTKPHNKTPYELVSGKVPNISHLKPFGCLVTILNTSDHLGKFEGKADEGFIVGYAAHSKAYRVYNLSSKKIEETLNLRYLEDKPNVQGLGQEWYFDLV
ncbi:putative ribonuclease H-like domain-containing protein [Tanacetum coccineum]